MLGDIHLLDSGFHSFPHILLYFQRIEIARILSFSEGNPEKPGLGPVFYFGDNVTDPPIEITIWQSYC